MIDRPHIRGLRAASIAVTLLLAPAIALAIPVVADKLVAIPQLPTQVFQGGLIRGRVEPGSRLWLHTADAGQVAVRVGTSGDFVIGIGRDEPGPVRLRLAAPDGSEGELQVPVSRREWRIERIEGVPQETVTPPPAIATRIAREQAQVVAARERDDAREDFSSDFTWPLRGRISGVYGSQRIYNGTPKSAHSGLDVAAAQGTPIRAPAAGIISFAQPDLYLTGGTVLIDHGHGLSSNFLHLSRIDVQLSQRVEQGETIGLVGATGRATGPHMHWGMNWFGVRVDPQLLVEPMAPAAP